MLLQEESAATSFEPEGNSLPLGREHITCDGPNCNVQGPRHKCSKCQRAFYCSAECQQAHWEAGHKHDCRDIKIVRDQCIDLGSLTVSGKDLFVDAQQETTSEFTRQNSLNTTCFICLSEPMENPRALRPCGHTFCFRCLQRWQGCQEAQWTLYKSSSCPVCRKETPDLYETFYNNARLNTIQASNGFQEERAMYIDLVLEELHSIDTEIISSPSKKIQVLFAKAEILFEMGNHSDSLKICKELERLELQERESYHRYQSLCCALQQAIQQGKDQEAASIHRQLNAFPKVYPYESSPMIYILMAECHEAMGNYKSALDTYQKKVMIKCKPNDLSSIGCPAAQHLVFDGVAKCAYNLGQYSLAIAMGETAIKIQRDSPQVHKKVAMAQRAMGNLSGAIRTMGKAIHYETPGNESNRKLNLEFYQYLLRQQANSS